MPNRKLKTTLGTYEYHLSWMEWLRESYETFLHNRAASRNRNVFVKKHLNDLLQQKKKGHALLHDGKIIGIYENITLAVNDGNSLYENRRYSVQKITDDVEYI